MINPVKGMADLFEEDLINWRNIEKEAINCFLRYGYDEIKTPILEEIKLFTNSIGEVTDLIEKEIYSIKDKDNKILALRPEATAGVVRAMISNKILNKQNDKKYFYMGPMFRRERPQKGRFRQFYQIGAEAFGFKDESIDIEVIFMLMDFISKLKINNLTLHLNTLGELNERKNFIKILYSHLRKISDKLCCNCISRLESNTLRILDCKNIKCKNALLDAPQIINFLSKESKNHFDKIKIGLENLKIKFIVNPMLVRGLDYYTKTVFELISDDSLGSQNSVAGGGRYDNLINKLSGKKIPAFGFSAGIERILLIMKKQNLLLNKIKPDIALIYADNFSKNFVFNFTQKLRQSGLNIFTELKAKSVKSQMRKANKIQAKTALIIGENEITQKYANLKMLFNQSNIKVKISVDDILEKLSIK